ncbi:YrzI family small protein [Peribacillus sp. SCS-37]
MTLHMLFFTIVIKKKGMTAGEAVHQETIKAWHEKNRDHAAGIGRIM